MFILDFMSFRELAVVTLGELSPSMSFLYDVIACVYAFLFVMVVYSFFTYISRRFSRW